MKPSGGKYGLSGDKFVITRRVVRRLKFYPQRRVIKGCGIFNPIFKKRAILRKKKAEKKQKNRCFYFRMNLSVLALPTTLISHLLTR